MPGRVLGTLWGWGAFGLACAVWAVAVVPASLVLERLRPGPGPREGFRRATSACLHAYVRTLPFMRLQVENRPVRDLGPRVLVANHQSWLDPIVLIGLEPGARGPARSYLFRAPALGAILRRLGFFPADGGSPVEQLQDATRAMAARSGAGGSGGNAAPVTLLFFPEGTRSRDGTVAPFQRGAFRIAYDHGLAIQPVVIEGLDRVLPPHSWLIQGRGRPRVRVRFLAPLEPPYGEGVRRDVVRALAERVHGKIADELVRMRADRPS